MLFTFIQSLRGKHFIGVAVLLGGLALAALGDRSHTVQSGDTLGEIGKRYGVSAKAIADLNNIDNPNRLKVGQVLQLPPDPSEPTPYTVRSGDTLGAIAQRHATSVRALRNLNNIDDPHNLKVGQILLIPPSDTSDAPRYSLPSDIRQALDAINVSSRWRYIVVHHTATPTATLKGLDDYHRNRRRMEHGLAYHFVIGNGRGNGIPDGKIEIGNRWRRQLHGGHLSSDQLNNVSIGICLVGNFEESRPTPAQLESMYALITYLSQRAGVSRQNVRTHREINPRATLCPGRHFPASSLRNQW
ncbi:MAG TPA: LysM peptidoglycan-binding domain-containing protein [Kiritimatiellia bacterium]|nr:LysM peptidoglycan-binding domain-containing protein [Kiritimatiellia bacterium]